MRLVVVTVGVLVGWDGLGGDDLGRVEIGLRRRGLGI